MATEIDEIVLDAADEEELERLLEQVDAGDLDDLILEYGVDFRPTTDDELHAYVEAYYGISIPRIAVCPDHVAPFTAVADLYFTRYPEFDHVWVGGRGSGKTWNFATVEHLLLHHFGDTIANIGAVEEQAKKCYSYIQRFDASPYFKKDVARSILSRTELHNGGVLEILPATKRRVNSPHPRLACWDEVDLTPWDVLQEGLSMPIRTNGRPAQTVFTSSLKFAYGPMVRLMDGAAEGQRAVRVYRWCVFEIIARCEPERHRNGEGCKTCPLAPECLDEAVDASGATVQLPGPGKAARADGFMPVDEVVKKYRSLDPEVWDSQWRSKRPMQKGLVYPMLGAHHEIDYEWNPELPVYCGVDFGFTNQSAMIFLQITTDRKIVAFAEFFCEGKTSPETAAIFKALPWGQAVLRPRGGGWVVGDPAAADARAVWAQNGIPITPADNRKKIAVNEKDTEGGSGISKIRWALAPMGQQSPLLYFAKGPGTPHVGAPAMGVPKLLVQMRGYHTPEEKEDKNAPEQPVKKDDHGPDGLRYAVAKIIRFRKD